MKSYFKKIIFLLGESRVQLPQIIVSFIMISFLDLIGIGIIGPFLGIVFAGVEIFKNSCSNTVFLLQPYRLITLMAVFLMAVYTIKSVFSAVIMKKVITFSQNQQFLLRGRLITAYQNMPYSKIIQRNSSDYVNAIQVLVPNFANLVMFCLQSLGDIIVAIMLIGFLAWTNPYAFGFLVIITSFCLVSFDFLIRKRLILAGRNSNILSLNCSAYLLKAFAVFKNSCSQTREIF